MSARLTTSVVTAVALVCVGIPAAPALASAESSIAKSACRDRLIQVYGARGSDVTASERGDGRYRVTGNAIRGNETGYFTCSVRYGQVTDINAMDWRKSGGGGGGAGTAAAVGGAIALAAIIAAASSKKKSHENDRYSREEYDRHDDRYYDQSYSPDRDITCYRNQRACFHASDNRYSARWTQREFGY